MKLIGALLGVIGAWFLLRHAPLVVAAFYAPPALSAVISGIAALLTAPWAAALSRLTVFEKLDDLTSVQNEIVVGRAKAMRRFVVRSMIINLLTIAACALVITFLPKSNIGVYVACASFLVWVAGCAQAYQSWIAADDSRLSIAAAQAIEKSRKKYLEAMRDDDRKSPIDRNDPHLNGYSR